jgi:lipopolysaccharide export system protein LptC
MSGGQETERGIISQLSTKPKTSNNRMNDARLALRQYSRFVKVMKVLLPSIVIILLALLIIVPQLGSHDNQSPDTMALMDNVSRGGLTLVNARYFGNDVSGQPFSVTADTVQEGEGGSMIVELDFPKADISLTDGTWLIVDAKRGSYNKESQVLDLQGQVNLFQDEGYELHTEAAKILLKKGRAIGTQSVSTQGPFGELNSQGFEFFNDLKVVHFTGPAKLLLNTDSVNKAR